MVRAFALSLVLLAAISPARAATTGAVYELLNPEAPRDEWRRQPLANAYVVMTWEVTIPMPAHATTSCRYSEIARTDQKGRYSMRGPNLLAGGFGRPGASVYAPGRDWVPFPYGGSPMTEEDITLAKSTRSPEARLSSLAGLSYPGCPGSDRKLNDPHGLLRPYLQGLLDEARSLNVDTPYGRNALGGLEATVRDADPSSRVPQPMRVAPAASRIEAQNPVPASKVPARQ